MAYEDTPTAYININVGGTYTEGWNLVDETGAPLTLADGWTGTAALATFDGNPVASFAPSGADGTLTFDNEGNVTLSLPAAFTATMTPTEARTGTTNKVLAGSLTVWRSSAPDDKWRPMFITARVYAPEVTQ